MQPWDDELIKNFCIETNLYRNQTFRKLKYANKLKPVSRINDWDDVDIKEIKIYIGIVLLMGLHSLPTLQDYLSEKKYIQYKI